MAEAGAEKDGAMLPNAIVLMGVSGSGKTTIGIELAQELGDKYADADDYHSAANTAKMASGTPLTDEDRAPWLATLNDLLREWAIKGIHGVLACSALKASYRETLSRGIEPAKIAFCYLEVPRELLRQRLALRQHSFMNSNLLDSQLATLEEPKDAIRVVNDRTPAERLTQA